MGGNAEKSNFEFVRADAPSHYDASCRLFLEYAGTLDFDLCFQNFDDELKTIGQIYGDESGGIILVREAASGEFIGCAGIRKIDAETAELKRMYIRSTFQHQGLGKKLLTEAITLARELQYKVIRLDTMPSMKPAIALYLKSGFQPIEAYRFNPEEKAVFMEMRL